MRRLAALLLLLAVPGCGLGEGDEQPGGAELRLTRDFGRTVLAEARMDPIREDETVMRLLQAEREVDTRYGGRFVQSIDGLESGEGGGRRDWFYWVNGVEAEVGAAEYELSPGDVVQWDFRRWDAAMRVPAIVGAFPEPFLHGIEGKRVPVRLECEDSGGKACDEVLQALDGAGVAVNRAPFAASAGGRVLRVIVARWQRARDLQSLRSIGEGPERSGVFARFDGDRLVLLDDSGRAARAAPPGSGLIAATGFAEAKAVWVLTAADEAGLLAAARALDARSLRNAFAVAALPNGEVVKLPVRGGP